MPEPTSTVNQQRAKATARDKKRSYQNLADARQRAGTKRGYSSEAVRSTLSDRFRDRFGSRPHDWQLDVTEAIHLGLDSVVIAGTGAGKTMPFMMPLLLDDTKKIVIISPLKVLQEDMVERFQQMNLAATAVNGETWDSNLQKQLKDGKFRAILTSPEMCFKHDSFRAVLTSSAFRDICAVVVDEAHCISQWGGDFRTTYGELGKLRAFFPSLIKITNFDITF